MDGESEKKSENLANKAFDDKKITKAQIPHMIKLAKADYDGTVAYIETLPENVNLADEFKGASAEMKMVNQKRIAELSAKSGKDLFMTGELNELKKLSPEIFELKYKEATAKKA
jgi:hypothetical protein